MSNTNVTLVSFGLLKSEFETVKNVAVYFTFFWHNGGSFFGTFFYIETVHFGNVQFR